MTTCFPPMAGTRGGTTTHESATDEKHLVVTIALHPDTTRIGEVCVLPLHTGRSFFINRTTQRFSQPGHGRLRPLQTEFASESAMLSIVSRRDGALRLGVDGGHPVHVNRQLLNSPVELGEPEVDRGVVVEFGKYIVLVLRASTDPGSGAEAHDDPLRMQMIGESEAVRAVRQKIRSFATTDRNVLVVGETGSGKDLVATALNRVSGRTGKVVSVNASDGLVGDSFQYVYFGAGMGVYIKGEAHAGYFEQAADGTLFIDEIANLSLEQQGVLLTPLNAEGSVRKLRRVGESTERTLDVRVVTATNADLAEEARTGRFRADLLHRLNTLKVEIPPLRDRREDVGRLAIHFVRRELAEDRHEPLLSEPPASEPSRDPWLRAPLIAALTLHPWPGNVRSLRSVVSRLVVAAQDARKCDLGTDAEAALEDAARLGPVPSTSREAGVVSQPGHSTPPSSAASHPPVAAWPPEDAALKAALGENDYNINQTARQFGVNAQRLRKHARERGVLRSDEPTDAEVAQALERFGGDQARAAADLEIPRKTLAQRANRQRA